MGKRFCWCLAFLLAGCAAAAPERLTVNPGTRVAYRCADQVALAATYYRLSDNTLDFVKVELPEGVVVTLPQALAASGVRYTDDRQWVWWVKGDAAFAEARNEQGAWQVRYRDCRPARPASPLLNLERSGGVP
jgi:membrane-bound inhibitor of C-type lysozyme